MVFALKNTSQEQNKIPKEKNYIKKAWVIFWESIGEHKRINEDEKVVAILNCRFSGERIRFLVQQIYTTLWATQSEKVSFINDPECNPFRAQFGHRGSIPCQNIVRAGHNPFLCARLVQNLRVIDLGNGKEKVEWDEIRPSINPYLPK